MHFTTLFLMKGEDLENLTLSEIEEDFAERFCYSCGETHPRYRMWCDWFMIGGRWCDILKAKKGLKGERSWYNEKEEERVNYYSVANIEDLEEEITENHIYAIATKSRIYCKEEWFGSSEKVKTKFDQLLKKINNKEFKGVVALIDCHD